MYVDKKYPFLYQIGKYAKKIISNLNFYSEMEKKMYHMMGNTQSCTQTQMEVNTLFIPNTSTRPVRKSVSACLSNGVAFADNSGSTSGSILEATRMFTMALRPNKTALWNTTCAALASTSTVSWNSFGGTSPSSIYTRTSWATSAESFVLVTDGQVPAGEVQKLANFTYHTSHLPTILGIAACGLDPDRDISAFNVSVLMSHFTASRNAIIVVMDRGCASQGLVWVLAAKGDFADHPPLGNLPDLGARPPLGSFPCIPIDSMRKMTVTLPPPQPEGTVSVNGGQHYLRLDMLLQSPDNFWALTDMADESELENIVRTMHNQGDTASFRGYLQSVSLQLDNEVQREMEDAPTSVVGMLSRLRHTQDQDERSELTSKLLSAAGADAEESIAQRDKGRAQVRGRRAIIGGMLEALCVVERAGMGADSLGRLSNRASRAKKVETTLVRMDSLDMQGAPAEEDCVVMLDSGPAALIVRAVLPEEAEANTSDFAMDFPLATGGTVRNNVWLPDVIGISDGTADQIEATQLSALAREQTVVAIPILSLETQSNRHAMFQRLSVAFGGGIQVGSIWMVALASIINTLETKEWASDGTPVGRLLHFLGEQIMTHVPLPKGHKMSPDVQTTIGRALAEHIAGDEFTQHQPLRATVVASLALLRWGNTVTCATPDSYRRCVIARAARCVPQEYLRRLKNTDISDPPNTVTLWDAIYTVRPGNGQVVPVAGSHHSVSSWEGVVSRESHVVLDMFARGLARYTGGSDDGGDSLITAGLTMVVRATLSEIGNCGLSDTAAVDKVGAFHLICAAEFNHRTAGEAEEQTCLDILAKWLIWARAPITPVPPFATAFGPSVLFFYHSRTRGGGVTDMTEGFVWGAEEDRDERMYRLTEHIRRTRANLLHTEYQANKDGSFNNKTVTQPLHRHMRDQWAETPNTDPTSGEFVSNTVERIMAAKTGNLHAECLEHDIAMLGLSLRNVGCLNPALLERTPLRERVEMELAGRTTDELDASSAPPAIWVPTTDPDIQAALVVAEQVTRDAIALAAHAVTAVADQNFPKMSTNRLSRFLTKLLRHTVQSYRVDVRSDGYVSVERLLALAELRGTQMQQIVEIADTDKKGRLQITEIDGHLFIRATQGHSIPSINPDELMDRITDPNQIPVCIHGTYEESWRSIRMTALDQMQRTHIQMAAGLPTDPGVVSGTRQGAEIYIYIDVARAMEAGIPFYRSNNNVICSPGPILPEFFLQVIRRRDNKSLVAWRN